MVTDVEYEEGVQGQGKDVEAIVRKARHKLLEACGRSVEKGNGRIGNVERPLFECFAPLRGRGALVQELSPLAAHGYHVSRARVSTSPIPHELVVSPQWRRAVYTSSLAPPASIPTHRILCPACTEIHRGRLV